MSRALVETYISGLALTEVAVVGAGKRCRIIRADGEWAPGEPVARRYFFKSSAHVDLLLAAIGPEGATGKPAAALGEAILRIAATRSGRQASCRPRQSGRSTRSSSASRCLTRRAG